MKRVRLWRPEIKKEQKGRSVIRSVANKKGKILRETSVMDATLERAKEGGDLHIIHKGEYMEEVTEEMKKKELSEKGREELAKEAESLGIKVVDSNKTETIVGGILKIFFNKKDK